MSCLKRMYGDVPLLMVVLLRLYTYAVSKLKFLAGGWQLPGVPVTVGSVAHEDTIKLF